MFHFVARALNSDLYFAAAAAVATSAAAFAAAASVNAFAAAASAAAFASASALSAAAFASASALSAAALSAARPAFSAARSAAALVKAAAEVAASATREAIDAASCAVSDAFAVARSETVTNFVTDLAATARPPTSVAVIAKLIAAFPAVAGYVTVTFEIPVVMSDAADATETVAPITVTTGVVATGIALHHLFDLPFEKQRRKYRRLK